MRHSTSGFYSHKLIVIIIIIIIITSFYRSPNIVRVIKPRRLRWAGNVARMEECRSDFKILTGTPVGKRSFGRPRRRWEDNIRMDLKEIVISTMNLFDSSQDRDYW